MKLLSLLTNLAIFSIPAALAGLAALRRARTWNEQWKLLAWLPVLPFAAWAPFIAWGVTQDPTSHNLWPFELVMWGFASLALYVLVRVARALAGAGTSDAG